VKKKCGIYGAQKRLSQRCRSTRSHRLRL